SEALLTSPETARLLPPAAAIAAATACVVSGFRPFTVTAAPAPAKPSAMARPMPRLLPVTTATFPSRENCGSPFMDPSSGRISRNPPGIALDAILVVFPKNRELLRFKRSFGVNCEYRLIAAEVASCKVGNQVDRPQPLLGRDAPRAPKVVINVFTGLGIS